MGGRRAPRDYDAIGAAVGKSEAFPEQVSIALEQDRLFYGFVSQADLSFVYLIERLRLINPY